MFGINCASEMLAKAKRDLVVYRNAPTPDNIFNLFVTIYHIEDYLIKGPRTNRRKRIHKKWTKNKIRTHFGNLYIIMQFVCNKNKHLKLRDPKLQQIDKNAIPSTKSSLLNGAALNEITLNSEPEYHLSYNGKTHELSELADQLISKWDAITY